MTTETAVPNAAKKPEYSRRTLRKLGRKKRAEKIRTQPEFAKAYFEAKSKRSDERKTAFRKRHEKK